MKKILIFASCVAAALYFSTSCFAQEAAQEPTQEAVQEQILTVENVVAEEPAAPAQPQALPFGYPPYPTVGGNPAYGVPYSYPRGPRRLGARFAPRMQYQPYPLPTPGAVAGVVPPLANPAAPTYHGELPPLQGTLGVPGAPAAPAAPTVYHRPTPIKNFKALMFAPRPYIGYNPYGGMAPAYQPQPQAQ